MTNHSDFQTCNGACCRNAAAAEDDGDDGVRPNQRQTQLLWKPWPTEALSMAKLALELTRQEWSRTGLGKMRLRAAAAAAAAVETTSSASASNSSTFFRPCGDGGATFTSMTAATTFAGERGGENDHDKGNDDESIMKTIVDRIVALLLIRLVALVASRLGNNSRLLGDNSNNNNSNSICEGKDSACGRRRQRGKIYSDYSTTTICKSALQLSSLDDLNLDLEGCYCDDTEWERNSSSCNNNTYGINSNKSHSTTIHNHHPHHYHHRNNDYNNNSNININTFPSQITPTVIDQLQQYVTVICRQYPPSKDVPYHNVEHAYHVFISANKLLDLLLCEEEHTTTAPATRMATEVTSTEASPIPPTTTTTTANIESSSSSPHHHSRPTYGLKSDPLSQFAYLFSALVHDVDHKGISNRQLVLEQDDLAILYNDQSVAEQRSLAVAFTTLKGVEYNSMREVLFPTRMRDGHGDGMLETSSPRTPPITNVRGGGQESPPGQRTTTTTTMATVNSEPLPRGADAASLGKNEHFLSFRKLVIDLVLVTDIASPERTQIVKSKWKEAFGHVAVAEKLRKRESASSAAAAAAAHSTGRRSSEVTKSPKTTSTCRGGTDGPGGISSNDVVVSRLGSQTSSRLGSGCSGQNSRRHSPFPDRQQNGIIALEQQHQQQQSTPSMFLPSVDFSDKQTEQEVFMPQNVDFFNGDTMSSSTSSPSLSTIQSNEEDDFDASAVSRSKMNFNNNDSGGGMPSPTLSYDSMEKLLEAAANYNVDDYDVTLRGEDDGCGRKHAKRSSYQHRKHPDEGDDNLAHNHGGEPLRWSTGDLSHGDNCDHQSRHQHAPYPSPMILSRSMKTHNEMRYMPRRLHKLGVRRALDLAGSTVTAYNDNTVSLLSSLRVGGGPSSSSELREVHPHYQEADDIMRNEDGDFDPNDEVDEFKATVVLEQLMHAADVAALFQDWENVVEWSTRLYKELNNGYLSNRGDDPSLGWYENQMKFFDFYILPLAKNLAVMGVFDEGMGERIIHGVKSNMARWIREGNKAALKMKEDEERRMKEFILLV